MLRIGIVAGEVSGDILAADLVAALKKQRQDLEITGIGGACLIKEGCKLLFPLEKLAVMGVTEVLVRFPELWNIRRKMRDYFLANPPDVFIGVDAPDFNFPLERALRKAGIKTAHYVSPSVWAWRSYRLRSIAVSVDLMLTVFPFENDCYEKHHIPVCFVGHPLARRVPLTTDKLPARQQLGVPEGKTIIALMPGSRKSELEQHVKIFLEAANWCSEKCENLHFISNLVDAQAGSYVEYNAGIIAPRLALSIYTGRSLEVMAAADVVLLASGTAALEAMLLKRPMVVGHKVNWLTYQIARNMVHIPYVSLPNVLAGRHIVPEHLQHQCTPENLGRGIMHWLQHPDEVQNLVEEFTNLHRGLRPASDAILANAVLGLVNATA